MFLLFSLVGKSIILYDEHIGHRCSIIYLKLFSWCDLMQNILVTDSGLGHLENFHDISPLPVCLLSLPDKYLYYLIISPLKE